MEPTARKNKDFSFRSLELAATLNNSGENLSPAFSSELGLMSLTFSPTRGCVLLLPR